MLPARLSGLRSRLQGRRREAADQPDVDGRPPRRAAILIPIVEEPNALRTIVFERTLAVADHKGEICFPGGSIEPDDEGPESAALREAAEELGIRASDVEILGLLDDVRTRGSNFVITPVVGLMRSMPALRADNREVARVFVVDLDQLCDAGARRKETVVIRGAPREVDVIPVDGGRIWGATLRALDMLFDAMKG